MPGITVVDRRDLERLLKAMVHSLHRDDVQVEVKFYIQFSVNDDYSAQTIVDPWQPFPRSAARDLVNAAINTLDEEERKNGYNRKALQVIDGGHGPNHEAAEAATDAPAESSGAEFSTGRVVGDTEDITYNEGNPGLIL